MRGHTHTQAKFERHPSIMSPLPLHHQGAVQTASCLRSLPRGRRQRAWWTRRSRPLTNRAARPRFSSRTSPSCPPQYPVQRWPTPASQTSTLPPVWSDATFILDGYTNTYVQRICYRKNTNMARFLFKEDICIEMFRFLLHVEGGSEEETPVR